MNKINCPNCKKEIIDVDNFLGLCDDCLGIDDKTWQKRSKKEIREKQDQSLIESSIKESYARLYELGCNKEQVRSKLEKLSAFFGNIGSISDLTLEQIGLVNNFLKDIEILGYKFVGGILK